MASDHDPMADIRASFFVECEELLESLQDGLELMSDGECDSETINIVFRAVHSIKGGAGAFSLDELVHFAHRYETALDEVRAERLSVTADALKLFFRCADILSDLVRAARDETAVNEKTVSGALSELDQLVGPEDTSAEDAAAADFVPTTLDFSLDLDMAIEEPDENTFTIRFCPGEGFFGSGNEPIHLIRALADLGTALVVCDTTRLPDLVHLDPTAGFLEFEITLQTPEPEEVVREIFDFVEGLCTLQISTASPAEIELSEPEAHTDNAALPAATPEVLEAPEIVAPAKEQAPEPPAQSGPQASSDTAKPAPKPASGTKATVRVDLERIDRLVNLVGELVINQAMLSQSVAEAGLADDGNVSQGLEEFLQLTRHIQDSVMMIRAQPVKSLFQRMGRIVREASAAVEKDVLLATEGESTEVDKTVIERLADPLTHMIRNAVDHGLENTEARIAAGKPAQGVVSLTAEHRSGRVIIRVADDGGGINREKVRQIAIDKGLIPEDASLSDTEIDNLLFLPGFSTAKEVSNLSGRGVGMDVVRSAIQALGGRVTIASEAGQGTSFSISLPLTLAVLDGMVVRVSGETLVVPLGAIDETFALTSGDIRHVGSEARVVHIRDRFVPLIDLGEQLGFREALIECDGAIVVLLTQEDGTGAAVMVDAIEDQRQVVIKGLNESYGSIPGISAATILGDGQIALILDPLEIISKSSARNRGGASNLPLAG